MSKRYCSQFVLIQMFHGDGDAKVVCIEHQDSFRSGPIRAPCEQLHDKKRLQIRLERVEDFK